MVAKIGRIVPPHAYIGADGRLRPWQYLDEERPTGCCYDCGLPYKQGADLVVSDEVWALLNPTYHEGAGLLCANCMGLRLRVLGMSGVEATFTG